MGLGAWWIQKTSGTQLRQEPETTRGLLPVVLENQVEDLEEEKATDPLAGRINILGRFLSFVLKLCLSNFEEPPVIANGAYNGFQYSVVFGVLRFCDRPD